MSLPKVEYFRFEEDFMEDGIRCIPMIVRFKLDACGVKLKLREWSKMNVEEREFLATAAIESPELLARYRKQVTQLIHRHTGGEATLLEVDLRSPWQNEDQLPHVLQQKLEESNMQITITQWSRLPVLQRFALLKLTRPGHENKNFPKAMKEFGLV